MAEDKEHGDRKFELPSEYDTFYYYYYVLRKLCDLKSVDEFFTSKNINAQCIFGYLYTVEMIMIKAMNELADFSRDWNVETLLHWSDTDLSDSLIRNLKKENIVLKYVYDLKEFKTKISEFLYTENQINFDSVKEVIDKIDSLITEINSYLVKEFDIKDVNEGKSDAQALMLRYVINTCYRPDSDLQLVVPGHPQPQGTYTSTYLGNERLIKRSPDIFNGYKYTFLYLLTKFDIIKGEIVDITNSVEDVKNAYDMRVCGSGIIDRTEKYGCAITFSVGQLVNVYKERDVKVENEGDLDFIFMRRDIRVTRASEFLEWRRHFDLDDACFFFIDTLKGMLVSPEAEVELLEITYEDDELSDTLAYSYGLYLLIGNSYANASYWIVFDRIALASTKDSYVHDTKFFIDKLIETHRDQLKISKVFAKRDLLTSYFTNKDISMNQLNTLNEALKSTNGVLAEFLAYLYTKTNYNAELIGFRVPYKETDIDALSKNDEYEFLCQAKSNIPITKKGLDEALKQISDYFDMLADRPTDRKPKNIAFIGTWSYSSRIYTDESLRAEEKGINFDATQKLKASLILAKKGIELVFYEDLRTLLLRDPTNELLVKELDRIIGHEEEF